jgi:hypothetical protein
MENNLFMHDALKPSHQMDTDQFRSEEQKKPTTIWKIKTSCELANYCEFNRPEIIKFANSQNSPGILEIIPSSAPEEDRESSQTVPLTGPGESTSWLPEDISPTIFFQTGEDMKIAKTIKKTDPSGINHPVSVTIPLRFTFNPRAGKLDIRIQDLANIWRDAVIDDVKKGE